MRWNVILSYSLSAALFTACGNDDDSHTNVQNDSTLTKGPGSFDANFRTSGEFFTLMQGPKAGASPHGTVQIWYSNNIKPLLDAGTVPFEVPEGTISIKTFQNGNGDGLAVMIKKAAGYDPSNGDWHYEMRETSGTLMDEGKIAMCIQCHSSAKSTDYLAGTHMR